MPISFDGDEIDEITIDGDDVTEVTMDGDVVWEAQSFDYLYESYEHNDLEGNYSGNPSQYQTTSFYSDHGDYALTGDFSFGGGYIVRQGFYTNIEVGHEFWVSIRPQSYDGGSVTICWGLDSIIPSEGNAVRVDFYNDELSAGEVTSNQDYNQLTTSVAGFDSSIEDEWITLRVQFEAADGSTFNSARIWDHNDNYVAGVNYQFQYDGQYLGILDMGNTGGSAPFVDFWRGWDL